MLTTLLSSYDLVEADVAGGVVTIVEVLILLTRMIGAYLLISNEAKAPIVEFVVEGAELEIGETLIRELVMLTRIRYISRPLFTRLSAFAAKNIGILPGIVPNLLRLIYLNLECLSSTRIGIQKTNLRY